ncbi:uncharacterized protein DSM5745_07891 [Aspergillus mulundensis]|uniref:Uncharacterized protein n=1 Tax=Aspergillus mulundensis TaxID=1810919 RepID=A0A3D8RF96_9EURO|nr:hypothetical protein DSM5745_07891 [Aspergillus mulundensis]RDW72719.1 hypothetical protein DSM5745_07891 [Aspergillus mulundensis]
MTKAPLSPRVVMKHRSRRTRLSGRTKLTLASLCIFLVLLLALRMKGHSLPHRREQEDTRPEKLIAIHLGPSESRVGIMENNRVYIIAGLDGKQSIPSYVAALNGSLVAGVAARDLGGPNLFKATLDMMHYLANGGSGDFPLKRFGDSLSYTMHEGQFALQVLNENSTSTFTTPKIYAALFLKLRSIAQSYLGPDVKVSGAVVTLPFPDGYDDNPKSHITTDSVRKDILVAGDIANLPMIRILRESVAIGIALGLDCLSDQDGVRRVLIHDLAGDLGSLAVTIVEIDDGVYEILAMHRVENISEGRVLEREAPPYNSQDSSILDRLIEGFVFERPGLSQEQSASVKLAPACPSCAIQHASIEAIHNALAKAKIPVEAVTDLVFMPSFRLFPRVQNRVASWFEDENLRIANAANLSEAPIWGATLQTKFLEEDYGVVGGWCSAVRRGVGVSTADGDVVEIIPAGHRVPELGKQTFTTDALCGDKDAQSKGTPSIKVSLIHIPDVDYHAKFELGDAYVYDPTRQYILLGELELGSLCNGKELTIEVSALVNRNSELSVQVSGIDNGDSVVWTLPGVDFWWGDGQTSRNITYTHGGDLEMECEKELKNFVSASWDQKATDALDRGLFEYFHL